MGVNTVVTSLAHLVPASRSATEGTVWEESMRMIHVDREEKSISLHNHFAFSIISRACHATWIGSIVVGRAAD